MKIQNLIIISDEEKQPDTCKGLIFNLNVNCYLSSHRSIETRKSLRLLKRKSCPGCEKCEWMWEFLQEEMNCYEDDFLKGLERDCEYKLVANASHQHWSGEWECELEFLKIDKEKCIRSFSRIWIITNFEISKEIPLRILLGGKIAEDHFWDSVYEHFSHK